MHGKFVELQHDILKLFHLRYLAVSIGLPYQIPASISNLENLQTLIIHQRESSMASYLPMEIWRMQHLRHLVFSYCYFMLPDPADGPAIIPLQYLQTLSEIASFACSKRILNLIPNLKKLELDYYKEHHHQLHNLAHLHQLEKLKITARGSFSWQGKYPVFPSGLKKLSLDGRRLPWKDITIVGWLPNLKVLKLRNNACDGDTWETADGEFPQLKFMLIERSNLEYWITERQHFPRLKRLVLDGCWHLTVFPDSIGEIPTLEMIEAYNLPESVVKSVKQIQEDQHNLGNDALQVRLKTTHEDSKEEMDRSLKMLERFIRRSKER